MSKSPREQLFSVPHSSSSQKNSTKSNSTKGTLVSTLTPTNISTISSSNSSSSRASPQTTKPANVIGEGSYGCIHRPSLVCGDVNVKSYRNRVSKVLLEKNAQKEFDEYETISRMDPHKKYHLGTPIMCKPKKIKYNTDALHKCETKYLQDNVALLVMKDGGKSIDECTKEIIMKSRQHPAAAIEEIKDILRSLRVLFEGLGEFENQNILHCDLKPQNVVYDSTKKKSYFIDFGLMQSSLDFLNNPDGSSRTVHWSFPMDNVFSTARDFCEYILSIDDKELFVNMACNKLFKKASMPFVPPPTINNVKELFKHCYKGATNKQIDIFIKHKKSYMENVAKSLLNFADEFSIIDIKWLCEEYYNFYALFLNIDNLRDIIPLKRDLPDELICKEAFKEFEINTAQTNDTYGMSLVFWNLLHAAETIQYNESQMGGFKRIDFSFIDNLRNIARQMSHPNSFERAQLAEATKLLDDFISSL